MNIYVQQAKGTNFANIKLFLVLMLMALTLGACNQKPSQNKISVSGKTLSAPLPSALSALAIDENNLVIELFDEADIFQAGCINLAVDQVNGTFLCNVTLEAGEYILGLNYSIKHGTYGTVLVAKTPGISLNVIAGETTTTDFPATLSYEFDNDTDGINNLAELDAGTDPNDATCIINNSLIDKCTLG